MRPDSRKTNPAFLAAWQLLEIFFPPAGLPNGASLNLAKPPSLSRNRKEREKDWKDIGDAITEVLSIGARESAAGRSHFLHIHVGFGGRGRILFVPQEFCE